MTPFDLQALLRDDRWMRRVARGLLRDPHDAEDAVQDAWLAELEARGGRLARRRGWLRGVLWNRASGTVRRERVLRERALDGGRERAESLAPSAAEDAAARELKRAVVEAVLELDEDLRAAVHLTYLADLSTREVAARTGVSPTAVRKRLARAHDELRRRLDAEHGGDRRAWTLALTPFLRTEPAPLAATAARHTEPRLAMRPIELLAAAAVAVTAVASFSFLTSEGGPPTSTESRSVELTSAGLSEVSPVLAPSARSNPSRRAAPSPAAASSLAVIRGRLGTPDGDPLVAAEWTLLTRGDSPFEDAGAVGPDGALRVEVQPLADRSYVLQIESPGLATEVFDLRQVRKGQTLELGAIRMRPESVLRCRLVDEAGEAVIDPSFRANLRDSMQYQGGWRGTLELRGVAEPGTGEIVIRGLGPAHYDVRPYVLGAGSIDETVVQVGLGEEVVREFVLSGGSSEGSSGPAGSAVRIRLIPRRLGLFSGTADPMYVDAVDAEGAAVEVTAAARNGRDLLVSDEFTPPLSLSINDPRFAPIQRDGIEPGDVVRGRLDGTSSIRLDVQDAAGQAIDMYAVRVEPASGYAQQGVDVHDGASPLPDGRIDGLYAGIEMRVIVTTGTHRGEVLVADAPAGDVTDVPVVLSPLTTVHGTVRHPDGAPAAFVDVVLARPAEVDDSPESRYLPIGARTGDPENCRQAVAVGSTDALGRFSIERPTPGVYVLRAANGSGGVGWSAPISVAGSPVAVEFELPRGASVVGALDLPEWIDPRDVYVRPDWERPGGSLRESVLARVDSDGVFRIDGLPAETIEFELRVNRNMVTDSALPPIATVTLEAGETRSLECDTSGSVPGEVRLLPEGADAFPLRWWLHNDYAAPGQDVSLSYGSRAPSGAPVVGPFLVEPGRYTFAASGTNWAELEGTTISIAPGSRVVASIGVGERLVRRAVSVQLDGAPLVSENIRIRPGSSTVWYSGRLLRSDELGTLDVALPEGEVTISVRGMVGVPESSGSATLTWPPTNGAVIELD